MKHSSRKRKCKSCNVFFLPDYRNVRHQRYCAKSGCKKVSKANSQRRWLRKPENRDHFRGPDHVQRVQQWRQAHPGYWRRQGSKTSEASTALQDHCSTQPIPYQTLESDLATPALQDICSVQLDVFIGLIAQLTGSTLQDDIDIATRRLQQLGRDILSRSTPKQGDLDDPQTTPVYSQTATYPPAVQLGRSAPGT